MVLTQQYLFRLAHFLKGCLFKPPFIIFIMAGISINTGLVGCGARKILNHENCYHVQKIMQSCEDLSLQAGIQNRQSMIINSLWLKEVKSLNPHHFKDKETITKVRWIAQDQRKYVLEVRLEPVCCKSLSIPLTTRLCTYIMRKCIVFPNLCLKPGIK